MKTSASSSSTRMKVKTHYLLVPVNLAPNWSAPVAETVPLGPLASILKWLIGGWWETCSFNKTILVGSTSTLSPSFDSSVAVVFIEAAEEVDLVEVEDDEEVEDGIV